MLTCIYSQLCPLLPTVFLQQSSVKFSSLDEDDYVAQCFLEGHQQRGLELGPVLQKHEAKKKSKHYEEVSMVTGKESVGQRKLHEVLVLSLHP